MKLFSLTKTTLKQQQLILEIFDQQKDGVLLVKNLHEANKDQTAGERQVLFKNNVLAEILPNDEMNEMCFKPKHPDGLVESSKEVSSVSIK
jgi:hypothetical protein